MAEWVETYRGIVNAWETDTVEHFTIAYYFDRFADARANYFDLIGERELLDARVGIAPSRLHVTFQHELRAGTAFHISSAVTGLGPQAMQLGHQVVDSTTGTTVTWVVETLALPTRVSPAVIEKLGAQTIVWPRPEASDHPPLADAPGFLAARDRVKPWEIAENGALSLPDHVHRFSAAMLQTLTTIGMSAAYMNEHRRGFSTFELDLRLLTGAVVGDMVDVRTSVAHLGNSSLRVLHKMTGPGGRELASMWQSGVHLDMEARRSTKLPADLRALATKLLIKVA